MAKLSKKHEKNLSKVQSMLDGDFNAKIQVGQYNPTEEHREVGDKWVDSDGNHWEQKEGFKVKGRQSRHYTWDMKCKDCDSLVIKKRDKEMYNSYKRCFECQVNFEAILKCWPLKFWSWIRLQQLNDMESIEKDMLQWIEEREKVKNEKIYDKTVANALANAEIDTTNVKLKQ